jgi:hypothetical protein
MTTFYILVVKYPKDILYIDVNGWIILKCTVLACNPLTEFLKMAVNFSLYTSG